MIKLMRKVLLGLVYLCRIPAIFVAEESIAAICPYPSVVWDWSLLGYRESPPGITYDLTDIPSAH